jgi:hypothetical protein
MLGAQFVASDAGQARAYRHDTFAPEWRIAVYRERHDASGGKRRRIGRYRHSNALPDRVLLHCSIQAILGGDAKRCGAGGLNMSGAWKTKYGMRRVRRDDPTLQEAIFAANGLTGNLQEQAEIAASLMSLPLEQVMPEVLKARSMRNPSSGIAFTERDGAQRAVIVERKPARRRIGTSRQR